MRESRKHTSDLIASICAWKSINAPLSLCTTWEGVGAEPMGPRAEGQRSEDEFEQLLQIRRAHFKLH